MAEQPLVSIVMPMFNMVDHVGQAVLSVVAQTVADWELIVVDDASTDGSAEVVASLAAQDPRIVVVKQPVNGGAAAARNIATERARGRYIAFLDADDLWESEKLEHQIRFARAHDYAFTHSWYRRITADGTPYGAVVTAPERQSYRDILRTNRIGCLTVMYDTSQVGKVYAPDIPKRNDYAMWLTLLKRVECAHCLPMVLASYRRSPGGLSSNKIGLIAPLYRLFRRIENLSCPASAFFTASHVASKFRRW